MLRSAQRSSCQDQFWGMGAAPRGLGADSAAFLPVVCSGVRAESEQQHARDGWGLRRCYSTAQVRQPKPRVSACAQVGLVIQHSDFASLFCQSFPWQEPWAGSTPGSELHKDGRGPDFREPWDPSL